jgi:hypothetical protein
MDEAEEEHFSKVAPVVHANNCNLNYKHNVECNKNCDATTCTNCLVHQLRKIPPTELCREKLGKCFVRHVSQKLGVGVFTRKKICENETIIEFTGSLTTFPDVQDYVQEALSNRNDYLYYHQLDENYWIDAEFSGNISRFINHSCNPNAKLKYWTVRDLIGTLSNIF